MWAPGRVAVVVPYEALYASVQFQIADIIAAAPATVGGIVECSFAFTAGLSVG